MIGGYLRKEVGDDPQAHQPSWLREEAETASDCWLCEQFNYGLIGPSSSLRQLAVRGSECQHTPAG